MLSSKGELVVIRDFKNEHTLMTVAMPQIVISAEGAEEKIRNHFRAFYTLYAGCMLSDNAEALNRVLSCIADEIVDLNTTKEITDGT